MTGPEELGKELGMTRQDFEHLELEESDLEKVTGGVGAAPFDEAELDSETTIISTTIIRDGNESV